MGFLPWLIFLFFPGHSMESLGRVIWICLAAAIVFGYPNLRSGSTLQWGTLIFFVAGAIFVNGMQSVWVATHMSILANASLASYFFLSLSDHRWRHDFHRALQAKKANREGKGRRRLPPATKNRGVTRWPRMRSSLP